MVLKEGTGFPTIDQLTKEDEMSKEKDKDQVEEGKHMSLKVRVKRTTYLNNKVQQVNLEKDPNKKPIPNILIVTGIKGTRAWERIEAGIAQGHIEVV